MGRVLIIDDDDAFREGLTETLSDLGQQVVEAATAHDGHLEIRRGNLSLVFLDYRMPGTDGLELLRTLRKEPSTSKVPIVVLTAFATSQNTIEAMKLGALDHLTKPVGRRQIVEILERAEKQGSDLSQPMDKVISQETLVGESEAIRQVEKLIGMASASDATVLISGETGTGKEMVARALHENSDRAKKPLVAVNCAAIPSELLESELFGHVRGAFTGAIGDRLGSFRQADEGTLFLDEIGDMSLAMQAKILRALQEREVTPVGSHRSFKVNVRLVVATHRDLSASVKAGTFREDLYYRLNVLPISLPPLRERKEDIVPLAMHFLQSASNPPKTLTPAAIKRLTDYAWPGNVRELKNAMERLGVLVRGSSIDDSELAFLFQRPKATPLNEQELFETDLPTAVARVEKMLIRKALEEAGGNRTEAARKLGIHRQLLYAKLQSTIWNKNISVLV